MIDLVSNGKVYFNHIEFDAQGNAVPTFTLSSADTPSPIIYDPTNIDTSVGAIDPEEQAEVLRISPMEDAVRVRLLRERVFHVSDSDLKGTQPLPGLNVSS